MLARSTLFAALAMALAPAVKADKFYLTTKEDDAKFTEDSSPSFIEGVLLREEDGRYVLRVEGGEIQIAKADVKRIDKDGLTVAQLVDRETAARERLAQANTGRQERRATEASARRDAAQASDAAAGSRASNDKELSIVIDFQGLLPNYTFKTYDPVLQRANLSGLAQLIEAYLREEVNRAAHRRPGK